MNERSSMSAALQDQLTLDAGGATVDTSKIGSLKWGAETQDLGDEFQKGSDVELKIFARVTDVRLQDKYDAHGNVSETIRYHVVRADRVEVLGVTPDRAQIAWEPDGFDLTSQADEGENE